MAIVDLDKLIADVFPTDAPHFDCDAGRLKLEWLGDAGVTLKQLSELSASLRTNEIDVTYEPGTDWGGETGKDSDKFRVVIEKIGAVPEWKNRMYGYDGKMRMVGAVVMRSP
jgi:hypothetical protein